MRYVFTVQYDGTDFSGYQKQKDRRTVQGELEKAAQNVFGAPVRVCASGRTDAGVHAVGQVCHADGETNTPAEKLAARFNAALPPDVRIVKSAAAPAGFDCTRSVRRKTYVYAAYFAPTVLPLLERYAVRLAEKPSLARMREGARLLEGEHDFKAFSATGSSAKTSVRTIYSLEVSAHTLLMGELFEIRVTGNGFLYNMVRILAGELVSIGLGKGMNGIEGAFRTGERSLLAKTMPAKGLRLEKVEYDAPIFGEEE